MPITFKCPKCDKLLRVPEGAGTLVRCPGCKTAITIPASTPAPPLAIPIVSAAAPAPGPFPTDTGEPSALDQPFDEFRTPARETAPRENWRKVRRSLLLNLVATGLYLVFVLAAGGGTFETIGTPQGGKATNVPVVPFLIGGIALLFSWGVALIGFGFALSGSRTSGGRGLALATFLTSLVSVGTGIFLGIQVEAVASFRAGGDPQLVNELSLFLGLVETARLTLSAFFLWAVLRSLPGQPAASSALAVAIAFPCVLLGPVAADYLLVDQSGKAGDQVLLRGTLLLVRIVLLAGVLVWFGLTLLGGRRAIDRHLRAATQ
ncbi:MAG TPA: hypothetical protein VKD72_19840 [Gemmataceae bacterium]|nr:hypothetical protein [Gemmataceae bacterium]